MNSTKKPFNKYDFKITDICTCECHQEDMDVMHCCPCCDLTYIKYISPNGKIQINKYIKLRENNENI